ncbi:MAG: hypothetical protein LAO30_06225 [Acidobacteriia bacterium]|nr:hypothetical protein [Terriglobia bacterium]
MLRHEDFQELCAAASIGQASPEELVELERHASECDACRKAYYDFLGVAAQQFASSGQNAALSSEEADECLNSDLFTRRFFARAEQEGIHFSEDVEQEIQKPATLSLSFRRRLWWRPQVMAAAAALLMVVGLSARHFYRTWTRNSTQSLARVENRVGSTGSGSSNRLGQEVADQRVAELEKTNQAFRQQIDRLHTELNRVNGELAARGTTIELASEDRQKLQADRDALEAQLTKAELALGDSQTAVASAQQEAAKEHAHAGDLETTLVADQSRMHDLSQELADRTAALDKERQLLAVGRDVSDLMAARNLHIVDVVDTDTRGKTQPAFGRIFFTEGKSLLFYAYDLNEAKMQKATLQYSVWAKKEGGDREVRNLGIFFSDDKSQRRWVFKCNDPKILSEIDSVFVTLEPAGSDPAHPKGPNLMYAYLRGQPNHP